MSTELADVKSHPTSAARQEVVEWRSCCFRLQPQAATFAVQVTFSGFLIVFSAYMIILTTKQNAPPDALWVSLLTTTVGVWLPSPLQHTGAPLPQSSTSTSSAFSSPQ